MWFRKGTRWRVVGGGDWKSLHAGDFLCAFIRVILSYSSRKGREGSLENLKRWLFTFNRKLKTDDAKLAKRRTSREEGGTNMRGSLRAPENELQPWQLPTQYWSVQRASVERLQRSLAGLDFVCHGLFSKPMPGNKWFIFSLSLISRSPNNLLITICLPV